MGKTVTIGYKYSLGMHMVLCHGPVDKITQIDVDTRAAWTGLTTGGQLSIIQPSLFGGDEREGGVSGLVDIEMGGPAQGQNSYLLGKLGSMVPAHRGVVGAVLRQVYLGTSPYLKRWSFWVSRIHTRQNGLAQWYDAKAEISGDMNPAHILRECLTDPDWGMGYPEGDVDDTSFTAAADMLFAEGMGISLLWDRSTPMQDFIQEILKHIHGSLFVSRSTGKFVLKLVRDGYDVNTLLTLDENSISRVTDFKRSLMGELVNSVTVVYWDASTGENGSVTVQDIALAAQQGTTIGTTKQFPGFTNGTIASKVAARELRALSTPLASATIYANRAASGLNIGDVFKFSWANYGVTQVVMRVVNIEFGTLDSNVIKISCVEDVFGLAAAVYAPPPPSGWANPVAAPAKCPYELVMEAPYWELVQQLGETSASTLPTTFASLAAAGVRPSGDAINAKLHTKATGVYEENGGLEFCPTAALTATITPDQTVLPIGSGVDLDLVRVGSYAMVDSEFVSVVSVTDSTLTVGRGVLDTVPVDHASGARLYFLDDFQGTDGAEYATGEWAYAKILPATSQGTLAIDSASQLSVSFGGRAYKPYPPGLFRIGGQAYPASLIGDFPVTWAHRDRLQQTVTLVTTEASSIGPEAGTTYTAEVRKASDNTLLSSASSITGTTTSFTAAQLSNYAGPVTVKLWSVRNSVASLQSHAHTMKYLPAAMVVSGTVDALLENGTPYSTTFTANTGQAPLAWSVSAGNLPTGLSLGASTGVLSGTPTTDGTYSFTVQATDAQGFTASQAYSTEVSSVPMILGTPGPLNIGSAFSFTPTTFNLGTPVTWSISVGSLPTGLSLNTSTGEISGTPTDNTPATFTLSVTDGVDTATRDFTMQAWLLSAFFESGLDGFTGSWARSTVWASEGSYSLASTNQGQHSTTSTSTLSATLSAAGTLTFDWKVSSESNFDKITVLVNGVTVVNAISGENSGSYSGAVPAGAFTMEVRYSKDSTANTGLDTAFVDNIKVI